MGGGRSCQSVCRRMALRHSRYSRRPHGRSRTQLCGALIRRAPRCRRTGRLTLTLTLTRTLTLTLTQDGQEPPEKKLWMFPAIAVLLQCILLFVGGLIFRIVRRKEDHAI